VYDGHLRQLDVRVPRVEAAAVHIDGVLDEDVWKQAALLTGFSQYRPVDSRPAEDSTQVLVFYAPDAIYFGIRAFEKHGNVVRATLADRDNIGPTITFRSCSTHSTIGAGRCSLPSTRWARNRTAFAVRGLPAPQAGEMRAAALTASSISTPTTSTNRRAE